MLSRRSAKLLHELLTELVVFDSPRLRKLRIGSANDGGYVVPNRKVAGVDFLYSAGVGYNLDFDFDLRARSRARIKLFDHTIPPPRHLPEAAEFFPVGLGLNGESLSVVFTHGNQPNLSRHRLWLKLDIEGCEWPLLERTGQECLRLFEVILIEFHDLINLDAKAIATKTRGLRKLNRHFRLVHAHGNNYTPSLQVHETLLPYCLETTYVRADLLEEVRLNQKPLPGPHDAPSDPFAPDLDLNCWPYRTHSA